MQVSGQNALARNSLLVAVVNTSYLTHVQCDADSISTVTFCVEKQNRTFQPCRPHRIVLSTEVLNKMWLCSGDWPRVGFRSTFPTVDLSPCHHVQTSSGTTFPAWVEEIGARLASYVCLVPRLRICRIPPPHCTHFVLEHRDSFYRYPCSCHG
jgi:hypothetical protein